MRQERKAIESPKTDAEALELLRRLNLSLAKAVESRRRADTSRAMLGAIHAALPALAQIEDLKREAERNGPLDILRLMEVYRSFVISRPDRKCRLINTKEGKRFKQPNEISAVFAIIVDLRRTVALSEKTASDTDEYAAACAVLFGEFLGDVDREVAYRKQQQARGKKSKLDAVSKLIITASRLSGTHKLGPVKKQLELMRASGEDRGMIDHVFKNRPYIRLKISGREINLTSRLCRLRRKNLR